MKQSFRRYIRLLKKWVLYGNWRIPISSSRRACKVFEKKYFNPNHLLVNVGNYKIPSAFLKKLRHSESINVLSLGLGFDISFDKCLRDTFKSKLFLVGLEPFQSSVDFALSAKSSTQQNVFDKIVTCAIVPSSLNSPTVNLISNGSSFYVVDNISDMHDKSYTLINSSTVTAANLLNQLPFDSIDIIKIDIESSSIPILLDFLELNTNIGLIVGEIENRDFATISDYLESVRCFFSKLEKRGYKVLTIPRNKYKYINLEYVAFLEP